MKKLIALLLLAAMCLPLAACGKSDAAKAVETMIEDFSGIAPETEEDAAAIQTAYNALTEDEQKKVKNYKTFTAERDAYYEALLTGTWYSFSLVHFEATLNGDDMLFDPGFSLTLNEDKTAHHESALGVPGHGTWSVQNGEVVLEGIHHFDTALHYYDLLSWPRNFTVSRVDGSLRLFIEEDLLVSEEEYPILLNNSIRVVDLEETDPAEIFGFTTYKTYGTDEWGTETGSYSVRLTLTNLLYEDGWMYLATDENFALEVLWPEFTVTYTFNDGSKPATEIRDAGSDTLMSSPFNYDYSALHIAWGRVGTDAETDLSLDDLSFGRARGKIYFINSAYVLEPIQNPNTHQRELLMNVEEYPFIGHEKFHTGWWEQDNQAY